MIKKNHPCMNHRKNVPGPRAKTSVVCLRIHEYYYGWNLIGERERGVGENLVRSPKWVLLGEKQGVSWNAFLLEAPGEKPFPYPFQLLEAVSFLDLRFSFSIFKASKGGLRPSYTQWPCRDHYFFIYSFYL